MRRYLPITIFLVALLTLVVWTVSQYIQPILPENINSNIVLVLAIVALVLSTLASLKDAMELFQGLLERRGEVKKFVTHNLPQPDYARFIGREDEQKRILELLKPQVRHFIIVIDGVGGVGKTALALRMAHEFVLNRNKFPKSERFDVIIWTTAKQFKLTGEGITEKEPSIKTFKDIFSSIASVLGRLDIIESPLDNQDDLVRHALTKQRTLLIVDNLETIDDERIINFIREIPTPTKVIVTTRHRIDIAYPVRLKGLQDYEAQELIKDEISKKSVSIGKDEIERLINRTGGIPLAIVWSISLMGYGYGVESVLDRLGRADSDIAEFCFKETVARLRGKQAYIILLALSLFTDPTGKETLRLVTQLPPIDLEEGLVDLEKLSLVNTEKNQYSLLPLTKTLASSEFSNHITTSTKIGNQLRYCHAQYYRIITKKGLSISENSPDDTPVEYQKMGDFYVSSDIVGRIMSILSLCDEFESDDKMEKFLENIFLMQFRRDIPSTFNRNIRIAAVCKTLISKKTESGENALAVLLQILSTRYSENDERQRQLMKLSELIKTVNSMGKPFID